MTAIKRFIKVLGFHRLTNLGRLPLFIRDYVRFKKQTFSHKKRFTLRTRDLYPCIEDRSKTHAFDAHYIYHPAWASRIIAETRPRKHVDISSSLSFVTIASAFVPIDFYDYRPADIRISNFKPQHADINNLPFGSYSVKSISCMHVIEHIGLGRYGDVIDYDGDLKAIRELKRVVEFGGDLLIVVPIGKARIEYNAHRIYSYAQILSLFDGYSLENFGFVTDKDVFIENCDPLITRYQSYGCGCFWFKRTKKVNT